MSPKTVKLPKVQIPQIVHLKYRPFLDYFKGFENVEAVRGIFGPQTRAALRRLKVEFFSSKWGYMGVSDEDGHLVVSAHYLRTGNRRDIYLDVVHELVDDRWFPRAEEELARVREGRAPAHRLVRLPHVSRRSRGVLGPLNGLLVDG